MSNNIADTQKRLLEDAIVSTIRNRGNYVQDFRAFSHKRVLGLEATAKTLFGMTGGSLAKELHSAGLEITPSAFIQRRDKIAAEFFHETLRKYNELNANSDTQTYKGYALWAADGTTLPTPFNPVSDFYVPLDTNPKGGFCNVHANLLYDIGNKVYVDCAISRDEQGALNTLIYRRRFTTPTILVLDRGYESYNLIAHLLQIPRLYFVLRVKQDKAAMREIRKLPMETLDTDIAFQITTTQTNADKRGGYVFIYTGSNKGKTNAPGTRIARWDFGSVQNPYPMKFRAVRFPLGDGFETLVTNLDRASFPADDLKEIYHRRWDIETSFRFLKTGVGLLNLHGRKDKFILQELYAHLTMFNFCQRITREVEVKQSGTKYQRQVNTTMAINLCKEYFRTPNADGETLLREVARHTEAVRPGRADKRDLKTKPFPGFPYRTPA